MVRVPNASYSTTPGRSRTEEQFDLFGPSSCEFFAGAGHAGAAFMILLMAAAEIARWA